MSDRYGLILVKDLDKFRKTQLDNEGEPLNFFKYAVCKPYGLKEDFEDNILYTPFQIRTDSIGIRLRNIINSAKRIDSSLYLPKLVKLKTIKNFIIDEIKCDSEIIAKFEKGTLVERVYSEAVQMFKNTLELIEKNENEFSYILIGIH